MTKAFGIATEYVLGVLLLAKLFLRHTKIESGAFLRVLRNMIVSPENTNIISFSDWKKVHHVE